MADENSGLIVWWIDDDHAAPQSTRDAEAGALVTQSGDNLDIVRIHPARFEQRVTNLDNEKCPNLLLIDLRLGNHDDPDIPTSFFAQDGVRLRGSIDGVPSLQDVPKYLVSGIINEDQSGAEDEGFEWVMSQTSLTQLGGVFLLAETLDYQTIQEGVRAACDHSADEKSALVSAICPVIRGLIAPPADDDAVLDLLEHVVSTMLRNESHYSDGSNRLPPSRPLTIGRWIRSVLQERRGPLIDDLAAATLVGCKVPFFLETIKPVVVDAAAEAQYRGVFNRTGKMTLWKESVRDWAIALGDEVTLSSAGEFAQSIAEHLGVPPEHQSSCAVCGKLWPEGIAFDEEEPAVEAAVHWRCSSEAADVDSPYGFDVQRSFVAE